MDKLARTVVEMMARAKRIYILMIKVNKLFSLFFLEEFSKRNRKHFLGVSIELYKHSKEVWENLKKA